MATPTASVSTPSPAHALEGTTLSCGWTLVQKLPLRPGATGSNFGVGYIAERNGQRAFVKAIDFVRALQSSDPLAELASLTSQANFEREALEYCGNRNMSKVVRLLAHEYVNVDPSGNPLGQVACLVMEFGPADLRSHVKGGLAQLPCSWILAVLRDVALAIDQLHRGGVAHHDVKPSNVISMTTNVPPPSGSSNGDAGMKLGDLGRIVRKGVPGPFDAMGWPGDPRYAPPERWYGFRPPAWPDERDAADIFMLGSLMFFLFIGVPIQPLLFKRIPDPFKPNAWRGGFDPALLLVLKDAHVRCLQEDLAPAIPQSLRDELLAIASDLTNPDPEKRGDVRARRTVGRPVGIDRIHQRLRRLSLSAAVLERTGRS
jgi:serine/threonine protein kinase